LFDASLEIDSIVQNFAQAMDNMGGEPNVKNGSRPI